MSVLSSRRLRTAAVTTALVAGLATSVVSVPAAASAEPSPSPVAARAGATPAAPSASTVTVGGLAVENSFVSSVGWVKPGDTYPSRIIVTNPTNLPIAGASVVVTSPPGATITAAAGATLSNAGHTATWPVPVVAAGKTKTLVLESKAATTAQDPEIVWRDLSTTAAVTFGGTTNSAGSHGPKVIPPSDNFDTARYGDRPFPVIPVQYTDRSYQAEHGGDDLAKVINDPTMPGSTFNLYQEMSLGQLFPHGSVPSDGIETADFTYAPGFDFSHLEPGQTCHGVTYADSPVPPQGTPLYPERITNGVYNLPGNTDYYGDDANGTAIIGAVGGVAALQQIDSGCGPTGKVVKDAATLADPEIDYSDYDTDKDGVVDFFMAVFAGCGGNGASQLGACSAAQSDTAPYDNIWPHSSSLEYYYTDPVTGLPGFTTDDQLKDLEGRPLWYTDTTYKAMTTTDKGNALKVFVRIGPYNLNPETAIDKASVISHEYGHSLGLPDFYSTGSRETYGDWNLMATDKSQNMDAFSRQELGWVVPEVLAPGSTRTANGVTDSKQDTGTITWQRPDGTPYTLENGQDGTVHNSQMFVAKLPGRQLLDAGKFDTGDKASKTHAWWSGSGNDFGCAPDAGRNLDLSIPELATLPAGSTVKLSFKSNWDIEWDYDYGYVLTSTDGGKTYTSHESENGYTTSNTDPTSGNPNQNACQTKYDNGITGTSGSYSAGTEATDRKLGNTPEAVFLADSYDISDLAGKPNGALRFSYATDPGLARPGWFIDDVKVTVTEPGKAPRDVLVTDFETSGGPDDARIFNGGCRENLTTAQECTKGWKYLQAGSESAQDHAYYMEMRDRSGFDKEGHGQIDRDPIGWAAGFYLSYTDEAHGYGNAGTDDPPAQSPLDSTPEPGSETPNLNDAAFTAGSTPYTDSGEGHTDNYTDPSNSTVDSRYADVPNPWRFQYNCLGFDVLSMSGEDVGPDTSDGNLTGAVQFTMGNGCGTFDYGYPKAPPAPLPNTAPTANATAQPSTAAPNQSVQFDGTASTDAETPGSLDYSWDFGDGGDTKDATGVRPTHAFGHAGRYVVTLTVTDPQGAVDTDTVTVTVNDPGSNQLPEASASASPTTAEPGDPIEFSGAASTDAESPNTLQYSWNFDDGGSTVDSTEKVVTHSFAAAGAYDVILTVTDADGATDTDTVRVTVTATSPGPGNGAPTARMTVSPRSPLVGTRTTLSATGSRDAETASGDLVYRWNFGDGGKRVDATGRTVRTRFHRAGNRTITLTVTDAGGRSDTVSQRIVVRRETSCGASGVDRTGSWRVVEDPSAPRGAYCDNAGRGAGRDTLTTTFRGPQVDVFHGRSQRGGTASVFIDGRSVGTVSFHSDDRSPRIRYHRIFRGLGSGTHTIRLVVTRGRAFVDGFITLR